MAGGKPSQAGCTLGGCFAASVFIIFCVAMTVSLLGGTGDSAANTTTTATSGTLSSKVPPNYATLFKEAAAAFKIDPAIIAGIYLTEHHTDSFGKDIKSVDATEPGCSSNSSGARGPMQIIDGTWSGVEGKLKDKGISNPDRCKYKDAFYGGAAVIVGKMKGQPDARSECKITNDGLGGWTDSCIKAIGRAYCGACSGPACGTHGYNYCEQTLRHFDIAKGSLAYLPPLLIRDPEREVCSSIVVK